MRTNPSTREQGPDVDLVRLARSNHGTSGILIIDGEFHSYTMEPPWRDNAPNLSSILCGEYIVKLRYSNKYRWHYHITDVSGRSFILCHSGNYGGDRIKELLSHTWGCILLGFRRGIMNGQWSVLLSRPAISDFMNRMSCETFTLRIMEVY